MEEEKQQTIMENNEGKLILDPYQKIFYLQYNCEKFWEISLEGLYTIIRIGKLTESGEKDLENMQIYSKKHKSQDKAKQYINLQIGIKRAKGYDLQNRDLFGNDRKNFKTNNDVVITYEDYEENDKDLFEVTYMELKDNHNNQIIIQNSKKNQKNFKVKTYYYQYYSNTEATTQYTNFKNDLKKQNYIEKPNSKQYKQFTVEEIDKIKEKNVQQDKNKKLQQKHQSQKNSNPPVSSNTNNNFLQVFTYNNDDNSRMSSLSDMTDDISQRSKSRQRSKSKDETSNSDFGDKPLGASKQGSSSVLLAHNYDKYQVDPKGYYISEKLDGVRCFWNGKQMYSRNGNQFYPPKWFVENWPNSQLDGELWTARNEFEKCISIVKQQKESRMEDWKKVKYLVFDCPGLDLPFKDRYKRLDTELGKLNSAYIFAVPHIECQGMSHLKEELEKVEKKNGEGLMIRDPKSSYEKKRSSTLLKVKTFHDDEAIVIGYKASTSLANAIGALHLRNTNGVEFHCGTGFTDAERKNPPKKGAKVTYKYQNLTASGKPRFPVFVRVHKQQ